MNSITALRLEIYQPHVHFRLPFAYRRRLTYPLPPYSTVIGFLNNILGIGYDLQNDRAEKLRNTKISVAGKFSSKVTESIWFRNMSVNAHINRFSEVNKRFVNGRLEHIGGQSLMSIDVLQDAYFTFYFYHQDEKFLEYLKNNFENPVNRLDVLHLGRAEDWIIIHDIGFTNLEVTDKDGNYDHFFWIPANMMGPNDNMTFENMEGLSYRLPTFCHIQEYSRTLNMHGKREFEYMITKLNDGAIKNITYWYDSKSQLPVFLANFN
jgi:CRISPR-associated protein Cas5t